jgi:hypothetical protein
MPGTPRLAHRGREGDEGEVMVELGGSVDPQLLFARWGWILALVVIFALVYRFGTARRAPAGPAYGCLVPIVITALFFVFVIF